MRGTPGSAACCARPRLPYLRSDAQHATWCSTGHDVVRRSDRGDVSPDVELKDQLGAELHLPGGTCRGDLTRVRIVRGAPVRSRNEDCRIRQAIVHAVEQVEHLDPQLHVRSPGEADILADGKIDGGQAGAA